VAKAGTTGWPAYQQGALEARQKAADTVAVQAVEAGAPDAGGGKSSSQDAMIFKLGRSAVATAGTTGWQAHQQGAFKACQQGGDTAKHNAAIKAVKAGAPTVSGGKSSSKDAMNLTALTVGTSPASEGGSRKSATVYMLSRSDKSPADTWQQREDLALTIRKKGGANRAADTRIEAMAHPIATHSHECINPKCRRPVKVLSKFINGKIYHTFVHRCPENAGKSVDGFGKHMCSTCHQTGRVCKDAICRYSKCCTSTSTCAHWHDGSGVPRK